MARGGKQPGAGRPKGSLDKKTLEQKAVLNAWKQRALGQAQRLLDAQLVLAYGQQFLFLITTNKKTGIKSRPELIEDVHTIRAYLNGELNSDIKSHPESDAEWYFITTKEPDGRAIDSIMDRAHGKAVSTIAGPDGGPVQVTVVKYAQKKK